MKKRILIYYMNQEELTFATRLLGNSIVTQSFVQGEVSDETIAELKKSKLVFSIENEEIQIDTPGLTNSYTKKQHLAAKWKISNFDNFLLNDAHFEQLSRESYDFPAYFLLTIDGPLLEEFRTKITEADVKLLQYFPENSYTALLTENSYALLKEFNFIKNLRYYGAIESGVREMSQKNINDVITQGNTVAEDYTITVSFPADGGDSENTEVSVKAKLFDLTLQNPEDKAPLMEWLGSKNIKIVGSSKFKVRVLIADNDDQKIELSMNNLVQSVMEYIPPGLHDSLVREIINLKSPGSQINEINDILDLRGEGQLVGIADTGIDDKNPDLNTNIQKIIARGRPGNHSDPVGHGTHVAGIIAGTGARSAGFQEMVRGIAPGCKLFFQSILTEDEKLDLPVDLGELFTEAYDAGVRIHNNSWGASTDATYTVNSTEVDDFVYNHKDMLLIFSAGNSGNATGLTNKGYVDLFSVGSPATAKNILTVGASRSSRTLGGHAKLTYGQAWGTSFPRPPIASENVSGNSEAMAAFSSRGPSDDNRFKPDIVAPGTDIASVVSGDAARARFCGDLPTNHGYTLMCGTSMAAPVVTGFAALIRQYYQTVQNWQSPSAALLKATIINGSRQLSSLDSNYEEQILPNNHQGFGIIDASFTIPNKQNNFQFLFVDTMNLPELCFKISAEAKRFKLTLDNTEDTWIRVCLAYTDPPARSVQNSISIIMSHDDTSDKWIGNFGSKVPYDRFPDKINNVQIIRLSAAKAGAYTIKVNATNLLKTPQDFALVITTGCVTANLKQN